MITKKERLTINSKKYYEKNREEINRRAREKIKNDPEHRARQIARQRKWLENNREKYILIKKKSILKNTYGISLDEYNDILKSQKNVCAICKNEQSKYKNKSDLCIDHNHKTNKVRGLLCHACNRALGMLKDDVKVLENAINYLKINV